MEHTELWERIDELAALINKQSRELRALRARVAELEKRPGVYVLDGEPEPAYEVERVAI